MSETRLPTRSVGRVPPLTELGLGTSQFGNLNRRTTDEASEAAVAAAWAAGVRYFDTAPHYGLGLSERRLGAALAGLPRDEYVLSTKVGRVIEPSPETAGQQDDQGFLVPASSRRRWDFTRDGVLRSVEDSLTGSAWTASTSCTCTIRRTTGRRRRRRASRHSWSSATPGWSQPSVPA